MASVREGGGETWPVYDSPGTTGSRSVLHADFGTFLRVESNDVRAVGVSDISAGLQAHSSHARPAQRRLGNIRET